MEDGQDVHTNKGHSEKGPMAYFTEMNVPWAWAMRV